MAIRLFVAIFVLVAGHDSTRAQRPSTPYKVVVTDNNALARSGPGKKYYPTSKFKQGDTLTVIREEWGGWLMIDPPAGSFSLVRQEYIDRLSSDSGTVSTDGVVVWVGSDFGGSFNTKQRHLLSGDEVQILGEQTVNSDGRRIEIYKIKPPPTERRWIAKRWVVPVEQYQQLQAKQSAKETTVADKMFAGSEKAGAEFPDPFDSIETPTAKRPAARTPQPSPLKTVFPTNNVVSNDKRTKTQRSKPTGSDSSEPATSSHTRIRTDHSLLRRLDNQFRTIIQKPRTAWDFEKLAGSYRSLKRTAHPSVAKQVDQRLSAVKRYDEKRQVSLKAYQDYTRVTQRIQQRDRQILSTKTAPKKSRVVATRKPPILQATRRRELAGPAIPNPNTVSTRRPTPIRTPIPTHATSTRSMAGRFDGAGIIQRSAMTFRGAPRHVLLAPNGRILAYLQANAQINLDRFVGQSMGVQGRRQYQRELQTDLMIVRNLAPVRLAGATRLGGRGARE